ncbi:MAG: hypothetical protein WAM78_09020 [Candidatus Sulfotelmatobacter sp.]
MSAAVREYRTAVMTWVDASWEDPSGIVQTVPARMEDKSPSGACIRIKTPISVGSKLRIQWRFERFSGTAKYCRSEGNEYLVGVQRDATNSTRGTPVRKDGPPEKSVRSSSPQELITKIESLPKRQESQPSEIPAASRKAGSSRIAPIASPIRTEPNGMDSEIENRDNPRISRLQDFDALRRTQLLKKRPPKDANEEGKSMGHKWLGLGHWRAKPNDLRVSGAKDGETSSDENSSGTSVKENLMPQMIQSAEKAAVHSAREVPSFQVELPPTEDIYREAGIIIPRKGYSIQKVVEMLNSEHIRGLSKEMKRAAVLMALDAAGISIDQIQRDAKARQDALDLFEAGQKKQIEAEWARKAEEVTQIQAELESIKAHYMARISRNMEGVAREKATFSNWQTMKQQEIQDMSEAAELCSKPKAPEMASVSSPDGVMAKAASAAASVGEKLV